MKIVVHFDTNDHEDSFAPRWISTLKKLNVSVKIVNLRSPYAMKQVEDCDGVMWHWFHTPNDKQAAPKILHAIEKGLNIPVMPNSSTFWHYDDKIAQHYLLETMNYPKVKSWIFWNSDDAIEFIKTCEYPLVFKLSVGAGAANVIKIQNIKEAQRIINRMFKSGLFPYTFNEFSLPRWPQSFKDVIRAVKQLPHAVSYIFYQDYPLVPEYFLVQKNYAYFQEFVPDNPYDIRITVIGNRAFGFIRYNRPNDFRASGSGLIDYNPQNIPVEAVRIAHNISEEKGFQSMAYDFLRGTNGGVLINEISYCFANWAVYNCPGHWDRNLQWHDVHMWPEEAHVKDFFNYIKYKKAI